MTGRPRARSLRIWASMLAVYALLLHAPTMAAFGNYSATAATASTHSGHGGHGKEAQANANACCVVCAAGVCAVGPVGNAGLVLPAPAMFARRPRRGGYREPRRYFIDRPRARGPPPAR